MTTERSNHRPPLCPDQSGMESRLQPEFGRFRSKNEETLDGGFGRVFPAAGKNFYSAQSLKAIQQGHREGDCYYSFLCELVSLAVKLCAKAKLSLPARTTRRMHIISPAPLAVPSAPPYQASHRPEPPATSRKDGDRSAHPAPIGGTACLCMT
jgi:hypothetical protein